VRAVALAVDLPNAGGDYPVSLWVGEEQDVLTRLTSNEAPDAADIIPANLGHDAAAVPPSVDPRQARALLLKANGTDDTLDRVGMRLLDVLERPKIRKLWRKERKEADDRHAAAQEPKPVQLRTYLDIRDPALASLPWEVLRHDAAPLFCQPWSPITRWSGKAINPAAKLSWPLKLLVIVGCDPADTGIEWATELHDVLKTVCPLPTRHWIDLDVFECRTPHPKGVRNDLAERVKDFRPDIVHFIGHARAAHGAQPAALELFNSTDGGSDAITAQSIINWFKASPTRLAVLNACRTLTPAGGAANEGLEALSAVGAAFLSAGTPAVVGMQHDVPGDVAARFASALYSALLGGEPIDRAVTSARMAILTMPNAETTQRNWALPTMTIRTSADLVLAAEEDVIRKRWPNVAGITALTPLAAMADRRFERRSLRQRSHPAAAPFGGGLRSRDVVLITGPGELGKTWLVKYCLEWFLLQGYEAAYVDFGKTTPKNAIEALRHIRGDDTAAPLRPRFKSFGKFNDALNAYLKNKVPSDSERTGKDNNYEYIAGKVHPDTIERSFELFCACLREEAKKTPLVIALDHIDKPREGIVADDFRKYFVPLLIDQVRQGSVANVVMLIAATPDKDDTFGLNGLRATCLECPVNGFEVHDWDLVAREFSILANFDGPRARKLIELAPPTESWKPELLEALRKMAGR